MGEQYPCGVPRRGHRPCGRRDLQVRRNEVLALPFVPTAIEFLERELIDIVERNLGKLLPVKQGEAVLIVMYDASSRQELDSAVEAAAEAALAHGAIDCCIASTPEHAASVWAVRGGILEGMKADSVAQEECDVVVLRARIAEYVKAAKRIALSHGIRVEPCGHCGDGNIHTEMLRGADMSDEEWKRATHASLTELYALSKKLGGQLSGEHGSSIKTEVHAPGFYEFALQILFYARFRADAIFSQRNISTN